MRARVALVLITLGGLLAPAPAGALDPAADSIVQRVTRDGKRTLDMLMAKVPLRGPRFELRVQQPDGSYRAMDAPVGERSFIGTVAGRPGALATGIVTRSGGFCGQISFDRGATLFIRDGDVQRAAGAEAPALKWPTTGTVGPGAVGDSVFPFDLAVDVDHPFIERAGSVAKALDTIECSLTRMRAIYLRDGLLMPRLARVVLRGDEVADPYRGVEDTSKLVDVARGEWKAHQTDADRDVVIVAAGDLGGGNAYVGAVGSTDYGYAAVGAFEDGSFDNGGRHELGHTFGNLDGEGGNTEGDTIMNGNDYSRFGGPELRAIVDERTRAASAFETPFTYDATPVPPYAALDLIGFSLSGPQTIDVLANDHDANGDALSLVSVDAVTAGGGSARVADGKVVYTEPPGGRDSFRYVIADTCGQTATGIVLVGGGAGDTMPSPPHRPYGLTGGPLPCQPITEPPPLKPCRAVGLPRVLVRGVKTRLRLPGCADGTVFITLSRGPSDNGRHSFRPLRNGRAIFTVPRNLPRGRYRIFIVFRDEYFRRAVRIR